MLASVTDFKTPEVMIWKYFDMGREKKCGLVGAMSEVGGWSIVPLLVNVLWVNWNVWGKKIVWIFYLKLILLTKFVGLG